MGFLYILKGKYLHFVSFALGYPITQRHLWAATVGHAIKDPFGQPLGYVQLFINTYVHTVYIFVTGNPIEIKTLQPFH